MLSVLLVVMLVAAAAVLAGVVAVAMGRGGELSFFQPDYAPLNLDEVTSTDIALFRPPTSLWGYSMNPTDEALTRIAAAVTERDIEIATLQQQVADLQSAAARRRGYGPAEPAEGRDSFGFQGERAAPSRPDRHPAAHPPVNPTQPQPAIRVDQPPARSVWEPARPAAHDPAAAPTQWTALPKRAPGSRTQAGLDDDEENQ